MGNYEYIISSLPFLTADYQYAQGSKGFADVLAEIRRDLGEKDLGGVPYHRHGRIGAAIGRSQGHGYRSAHFHAGVEGAERRHPAQVSAH